MEKISATRRKASEEFQQILFDLFENRLSNDDKENLQQMIFVPEVEATKLPLSFNSEKKPKIKFLTNDHLLPTPFPACVKNGMVLCSLTLDSQEKLEVQEFWEKIQLQTLRNMQQEDLEEKHSTEGKKMLCMNGFVEFPDRFSCELGWELLYRSYEEVVGDLKSNSIDFQMFFPPPGLRTKLAAQFGFRKVVYQKVKLIPCEVTRRFLETQRFSKYNREVRGEFAKELRMVMESWSRKKMQESLTSQVIEEIYKKLEEKFDDFLLENPIPKEGMLPYCFEYVLLEQL